MRIGNLINRLKYYSVRSKLQAYQQIDGWLTKAEAYGLFYCASQLQENAVVVEIGTWKGKSTYCIAKGLQSGKIFSVDPFDASGEVESAVVYNAKKGDESLQVQFEQSMSRLGVRDKIAPMKGLSNQFVGKFPAIDFLFIDGDHSIEGCKFDFTSYSPYVQKNGFVAFHDYDSSRDDLGPTWVVKNMVMKASDFTFVNQFDSLWVAQKNSS